MIMSAVSDLEWQHALSEEQGDWRLAIGALLLAWCRMQYPEREILTIKKWGFISFTIRVKHVALLVPVLFGKQLAGGGDGGGGASPDGAFVT